MHGTTRRQPLEVFREQESQTLTPGTVSPTKSLTGASSRCILITRRTTKDGYVSYNGNDYSVPERLGRRDLPVRATLTELHLLSEGRVVAVHPLAEGRRRRVLAPGHRERKSVAGSGDHPVHQSLELVKVERRDLEVYERVLS